MYELDNKCFQAKSSKLEVYTCFSCKLSYCHYLILWLLYSSGCRQRQATPWNCFYLLGRCLKVDLSAVRWGFLSPGGSGFLPVFLLACVHHGVGDLSCNIQTKHKNGHLWPDLEILQGSTAALGFTDCRSVQQNFSIKGFLRQVEWVGITGSCWEKPENFCWRNILYI